MRLQKVHISNFRSILDSQEFDIGDVTCLVGKNESGKTALLEALYRLNPVDESAGTFDDTEDYPRFSVSDYQDDVESGRRKPAEVCSATFVLEDSDLERLFTDYGQDVLEQRTLRLSKGYGNQLKHELHIAEASLCNSLITKAQIRGDLAEQLEKIPSLSSLTAEIEKQKTDDNTEHLQRLTDELTSIQKGGGPSPFFYTKYIAASVPRFLYFSDYWLLKGRDNIEALIKRQTENKLEEADHPLLGLIALANLNLADLVEPNRTQDLKNRLEGAGNKLTREVMKYWSQNKNLSTRFDIRPALAQDPEGMREGTNFWADIYDSKHLATTSLGRRSKGFVWFFSFLAYFSQQKKSPHSLILLLDEPGLSLHGTAQGDLLRYIEAELKPEHQVIYTTHSPFMVDPQHFERIRIVQDKGADIEDATPDEDGTKVFSDVLEATAETLFPLQAALGYEIHQTLFVGPNMLVVEGPSDLLYLQELSEILRRRGRTSLSEAWTIVPVGGAGRVPAFVALLNAQRNIRVVTLLDIDKRNRQMIDNIIKKKLLKKGHIFEFSHFCAQREADIEDLFDRDFYFDLVRRAFEDEPLGTLDADSVSRDTPRVIVAIQRALKIDRFNHYRPARYFVDHVSDLEPLLTEETLKRFESVFDKLNAVLPKGHEKE